MINITPIGRLGKDQLSEHLGDLLEKLFNLSGKYADEEKILQFTEALTKQLPATYGNLLIKDIEAIFDNAIRGEYGELKTISLPLIFQWLKKASHGAVNNSGGISQTLYNHDNENYQVIDWSQQVYWAYQKYLNGGLKLGEISRFIYDRLMLDNWISVDAYKSKLDKAKQMMPDADELEVIYTAQKMCVINRFEELKRDGKQEIYSQYK